MSSSSKLRTIRTWLGEHVAGNAVWDAIKSGFWYVATIVVASGGAITLDWQPVDNTL
jgi:hypothetical protein